MPPDGSGGGDAREVNRLRPSSAPVGPGEVDYGFAPTVKVMAKKNWDVARRRDAVRARGGVRADLPYDLGLDEEDRAYYRSGGGNSAPPPRSNEQLKQDFLRRQAIGAEGPPTRLTRVVADSSALAVRVEQQAIRLLVASTSRRPLRRASLRQLQTWGTRADSSEVTPETSELIRPRDDRVCTFDRLWHATPNNIARSRRALSRALAKRSFPRRSSTHRRCRHRGHDQLGLPRVCRPPDRPLPDRGNDRTSRGQGERRRRRLRIRQRNRTLRRPRSRSRSVGRSTRCDKQPPRERHRHRDVLRAPALAPPARFTSAAVNQSP